MNEMDGSDLRPKRRGMKPRDLARTIVVAGFALSLVLSVMTGLNYTDIVKTKTLSNVITADSVAVTMGADGGIESLNLTLEFSIVNPGGKTIRAWILTYKGWLRDLPYELGLDSSRWRIDGELEVNGTLQRYFPVFVASYSFDNPQVLVPPRSNVTIVRHITVNWSSYPDIMEGIEAIYEHAAGTGAEPEWLHYTSGIMFISAADLEIENPKAALIRWVDGVDITQGVGGAGP